jgi:hypothetical protein
MPSSETGLVIPFNRLGLPCGYDRADGRAVTGGVLLGTPTPTGRILTSSVAGTGIELPIEEEADSPVIENAEQQTITHRFKGGWNELATRMRGLHRGIIRTDSQGTLVKLLSAMLQKQPGGRGTVTTVDEVMTGDTPPDRFECVPVELGLHIIKHPRYIHAFLGNRLMPSSLATGDSTGGYGSVTEAKNQAVIRLLQDYMENTSAPWRNNIQALLIASLNSEAGSGDTQPPVYTTPTDLAASGYPAGALVQGTKMAKAAALEIIIKYWRGEETPSVVGFQITWTQYFWYPVYLNPGGFIEDPIQAGLPAFLWSTKFPPDPSDFTKHILAAAAMLNPQSYSRNGKYTGAIEISWRREADQEVRERTFFGVQHRWCGSPIGHWDPQFYTHAQAPTFYGNYIPPTDSATKDVAWEYTPPYDNTP